MRALKFAARRHRRLGRASHCPPAAPLAPVPAPAGAAAPAAAPRPHPRSRHRWPRHREPADRCRLRRGADRPIEPRQLRGDGAGSRGHGGIRQPLLSTLVAAVKRANLVDSLNTAQDITVFAPTNDAFGKIPKADLDKVLADQATLTKILTYHVVPGRLTPAQLAGTHKTLEGGEVTIAGSGTDFTVNGNSAVVCGNVQTSNATVYIIDTVLMPTAHTRITSGGPRHHSCHGPRAIPACVSRTCCPSPRPACCAGCRESITSCLTGRPDGSGTFAGSTYSATEGQSAS
jgi:uncharacterized surface protein with fasciclin (FAS1) repeats